MNYRENLTWARIAPLLLLIGTGAAVLAVPGRPAMADLIKYKWSGTMTPLEANVDPWNIGAEKRFVISVLVNQDSLDLHSEVDIAIFELSSATLLIDGMSPTLLNGGRIFFADRESRDSISIDFDEVEFNGVRERFFTGVRLPTSTFTFVSIFESPPVFSPADTTTGGGTLGDGSSYGTFSGVGATVTAAVIPEPSSLVLAVLASLGVGITRWRSPRRRSRTEST